ncbi:MAG: ATP phosphoribosyltransferase regulatory subunit, partial [Cyclobacteriaceae bacterium]|nr:ATP phosphoribosyltransferase regulatory subunit [Cyclobacteriaceae bacterium]
KLDGILFSSSSNEEKLSVLASTLTSERGTEGIEDIKKVFDYLRLANTESDKVQFDLTLARGLSYYTGCIFEVKVNNVSIGSVGGGGRYDNLTSVFGGDRLPGVGFSFGVDRIYDVVNELNLFPDKIESTTQVLIIHFDESTFQYSLNLLGELRRAGISSEIYPDQHKLKKQMQYGNKKNIPYILIIGSEEVSSGNLTLKNMHTGTEEKGTIKEIIQIICP